MNIEKKQSYRAFCQEEARKTPDYSVGTLAGMLAMDIIRDRINAGSPPGVIETKEINQQCIDCIYTAVESGELEAKYLEEDIITNPFSKEVIKVRALWIIETQKYIAWAKANGVGPRDLVDDVIEYSGNQAAHDDAPIDNEWKTKNEREFTYRTIGGLTLLLIEKNHNHRFGSRDNPNKSGIYNAIGQILDDMNFKTEGQTKSLLNDVLNEALDTAMSPKIK